MTSLAIAQSRQTSRGPITSAQDTNRFEKLGSMGGPSLGRALARARHEVHDPRLKAARPAMILAPSCFAMLGCAGAAQALTAGGQWVVSRHAHALSPKDLIIQLSGLLVAELLSAVAQASAQLWATDCYANHINQTSVALRGRTTLWAGQTPELSEAHQVRLGAQAWQMFTDASFSTYSVSSLISGIACNAGSLAALLQPDALLVLSGGAAVSVILCALISRWLIALRRGEDDRRMACFAHSSIMLDNLMLPNSAPWGRWQRQWQGSLTKWRRAGWSMKVSESGHTLALASVSMFPVVFQLCSQQAVGNLSRLALLLPQMIRLLSQVRLLLTEVLDFRLTRASLQTLRFDLGCAARNWLARLESLQSEAGSLRLTHEGRLICLTEVLADFSRITTPGRWRIEGPNGSGKSTLLCALVDELNPVPTCYLPARSSLVMSGPVASDGVRQLVRLRDTLASERAQVFLIDEAISQTDQVIRAECEQLLTQKSRIRSVVEVRH